LAYWLHFDGHTEELESAVLGWSEFRIEYKGGIGALHHRHDIAGDGGEIIEKRAKAVDRPAIGSALGCGLALGGAVAFGLGDD
jgi:hypothetical protein